MKQSNLKNMIVLRNLPSNIVEEAIIILKTNKKIKQVEKIEKDKKIEKENFDKEDRKKDYVVKEAEILVSNYISRIEEKKKLKNINNKKSNKKYLKFRNYSIILSLIILVETIILLIK